MLFILFLFIVCVYLVFVFIVYFVMRKVDARKSVRIAVVLLLLSLPFVDIVVPQGLFLLYRAFGPLQEVRHVVDAPGSVCWIDNVWPGFDEYGRDWMVRSYLDGTHLQALALNGDDGKVYVYRFEAPNTPEVLDSIDQLPPMRYQVTFDRVPLGIVERLFVHGDEIRITDLETGEVLAYSRRYLAYSPKFLMPVRTRGKLLFEGGGSVGNERAYEFDDEVVFRYAGVRDNFESIKNEFDRSGYNLSSLSWQSRRRK